MTNANDTNDTTTFTSLPQDLIHGLYPFLSAADLAALSLVSRRFNVLTNHYGWKHYVRAQRWHNITHDVSALSWQDQAAIGTAIDRAWDAHTFTASLISRRWRGKSMPVVRVNGKKIVVGVGPELHLLWLGQQDSTPPPPAPRRGFRQDRSLSGGTTRPWQVWKLGKDGVDDVTDIVLVEGTEDEAIVSHVNGNVFRVRLPRKGQTHVPEILHHYKLSKGTVQSISMAGKDKLLAASSTSQEISLFDLRDAAENTSKPLTTIFLPSRPWIVYPTSPNEFAIGSSGTHPLSFHTLTPSSIVQTYAFPASDYNLTKSAVYGLCSYTPSTLLSGWYDGAVRLHDLRAPPLSTPQLELEFRDPHDAMSAVYSLTTNGPGGHQIIAGAARNGVIRVWDARYASTSKQKDGGWSIFLGRERSPVYSVQAEHGKIFASTESGVYELDFASSDILGDSKEAQVKRKLKGRREILYKGEEDRKDLAHVYTHVEGMPLYHTDGRLV
ncbi:hypothetical protein SAICODRAFT_18957 [Saitoella complicata NRRL Y-17804]|nr:uncharacterized protein SAICODRAFT_18957 [Saitoella complicata NRRL Y-17804]ODQ53472.1 hypothetical protein SAICODRAFT_18957 [Saitoella complicata NRRL Y-17804]